MPDPPAHPPHTHLRIRSHEEEELPVRHADDLGTLQPRGKRVLLRGRQLGLNEVP